MAISLSSLAPLILLAGLATPASAQYVPTPGGAGSPGGYGRPPGEEPDGRGIGGQRGGMRGKPPGNIGDMPTPSRIEGPATPAVMHDTIGLRGEPQERYAERYAAYMAETGALRDSVRSSLEAMRSSSFDENRSATEKQSSQLQRQWKHLSKSDKAFEKRLKDLLTKNQRKRYKKWKEAREKTERDLWEDRRRSGAGPGPSW